VEAQPRAQATALRRSQILDAALACFTAKGYAATTMADVRRASGASIGSIYHHFASKEELAAALYVEGLRDYQRGAAAVLREHPGAEEGTRALVQHHLGWVTANPDLAQYLMSSREAEVVLATRGPLRELNRAFFGEIEAWLEAHRAAGRIRPLPFDVHHAILIGPCQELARLWLAGRTTTDLEVAAGELAAAAWNALKGARA
jgi:AcrR family transcriptional regulator